MIYTNTRFFSGNNPKFLTTERPQIPPVLHTRLFVACQHCVKLKNKIYNMKRVWVNHQEAVEWWEGPFLVPTQVQKQAWGFDILRMSIICLRSSRQILYITSYLFIHSFVIFNNAVNRPNYTASNVRIFRARDEATVTSSDILPIQSRHWCGKKKSPW